MGAVGWSREEMLACLAFYASLPKNQRRVPPGHVLNALSKATGRSPGSISLRFANFNSVDPLFTNEGLKGMTGGGSHVAAIWREFSLNDGTLDKSALLRHLGLRVVQIEKTVSDVEQENNG